MRTYARNGTRKCTLCKQEIKIYCMKVGNHANKARGKWIRVSDHGVFWQSNSRTGRWFCNKCWEKVLRGTKRSV